MTTIVTSTYYTSVLTIPAVQALDGTTVVCGDGTTGAVVGSGTVNLRMAGTCTLDCGIYKCDIHVYVPIARMNQHVLL